MFYISCTALPTLNYLTISHYTIISNRHASHDPYISKAISHAPLSHFPSLCQESPFPGAANPLIRALCLSQEKNTHTQTLLVPPYTQIMHTSLRWKWPIKLSHIPLHGHVSSSILLHKTQHRSTQLTLMYRPFSRSSYGLALILCLRPLRGFFLLPRKQLNMAFLPS